MPYATTLNATNARLLSTAGYIQGDTVTAAGSPFNFRKSAVANTPPYTAFGSVYIINSGTGNIAFTFDGDDAVPLGTVGPADGQVYLASGAALNLDDVQFSTINVTSDADAKVSVIMLPRSGVGGD